MRERVWGILRFSLGMVQMAAATIALILLVRTGLSPSTLVAAIATCVATTISVLLFGSRPRRRVDDHVRPHSRT